MFGLLKWFLVFLLGLTIGSLLAFGILLELDGSRLFGYQLDFRLRKPEFSRYLDKVDGFSFFFPKEDELEASPSVTKRFGADFLVGFHDKQDSRVGCEVRRRSLPIDFSLSDEEIGKNLSAEFGKGVKDFTMTRSARIGLADSTAFQFNFTFADPLGAVVAINQVLLPRDKGTILLICGSGKAYFDKFTPAFTTFFGSFKP